MQFSHYGAYLFLTYYYKASILFKTVFCFKVKKIEIVEEITNALLRYWRKRIRIIRGSWEWDELSASPYYIYTVLHLTHRTHNHNVYLTPIFCAISPKISDPLVRALPIVRITIVAEVYILVVLVFNKTKNCFERGLWKIIHISMYRLLFINISIIL